jgi:hypothetical protein
MTCQAAGGDQHRGERKNEETEGLNPGRHNQTTTFDLHEFGRILRPKPGLSSLFAGCFPVPGAGA